MREAIRFTLIVSLIVGLIIFTIVWPVWGFSIFGIVLFAIGLYDIFQKEHTILRNFPLLGHMRYMLELISPEIHQYFIENDTDGKPIDRNHRSYIYQRAKLQKETHPFGTQLNVEEENFKWMRHSIYPTKVQKEYPRVNIGGPDCEQTYSASLFNILTSSENVVYIAHLQHNFTPFLHFVISTACSAHLRHILEEHLRICCVNSFL